jgi:energy-coupling factor transport system substrate-specific component
MFSEWWKWVVSILLMTLASIIVATPIVVIMFGGITGGVSSIVTAFLMQTGTNIWLAVISSDGPFQFLDRIISCIISWFVIKIIPDRTLIKFGCGLNYIKKKGETEKNEDEPTDIDG